MTIWTGKSASTAVIAALAACAVAFGCAPAAIADPDPHLPDGAANWCPGGKRPGYGGQRHCLGQSFADGTFYEQTWSYGPSGFFAPGHWFGSAACSQWIEGSIQGAVPNTGACGGGPMARDIG